MSYGYQGRYGWHAGKQVQPPLPLGGLGNFGGGRYSHGSFTPETPWAIPSYVNDDLLDGFGDSGIAPGTYGPFVITKASCVQSYIDFAAQQISGNLRNVPGVSTVISALEAAPLINFSLRDKIRSALTSLGDSALSKIVESVRRGQGAYNTAVAQYVVPAIQKVSSAIPASAISGAATTLYGATLGFLQQCEAQTAAPTAKSTVASGPTFVNLLNVQAPQTIRQTASYNAPQTVSSSTKLVFNPRVLNAVVPSSGEVTSVVTGAVAKSSAMPLTIAAAAVAILLLGKR